MNSDEDYLNIDFSNHISCIWIRCGVKNLTDGYNISQCYFTYYNKIQNDGYFTFVYKSEWILNRSGCIIYRNRILGFRLKNHPKCYVKFELKHLKITTNVRAVANGTRQVSSCEEITSNSESEKENWIYQRIATSINFGSSILTKINPFLYVELSQKVSITIMIFFLAVNAILILTFKRRNEEISFRENWYRE
ncbi:hypothetical protein RF11_11717 [Thelohanellus kitauei]|uniref:Uncharacterized protein n=1 Tax=Thelohanellus kitauei TaxID=669202 RepID=A0A0C2N8X5_THEKT|nr:hypothetical protein RF11_11717 [Thelohanellus kitauei]